MEFFGYIENTPFDESRLRQQVTIERLPALCDSISEATSTGDETGSIYCSWGGFEIRRELIRSGLRFSLPDCPNALAWTIVVDDDIRATVVHCTINKEQHDEDFVESIRVFVSDWVNGLVQLASQAGTG